MAFRKITSLVDAAGEALGLTEDPLATIIGMRIEEAVDDDIDIENWEYSNSDDPDICDLILTTDGGDLQAVRAIKKKLQKTVGSSPKSAISTLNILENCVKNCGKDFVIHVCQKEYIEDLVYIVMSENTEVNDSVQTKLLALVQSWAFEYSSDREYRGIAEVYMKLKDDGVIFPPPSEDDLKEADSEDIEAFFNAHEDDDGPVLEVLENLMDDVKEESVGDQVDSTSDEFNDFLAKRVVNVEVEALREKLKREVESLSVPEEEIDEGDLEDEDNHNIVAEMEKEMENEYASDCDFEEMASEELKLFLSRRVEAVENGN